MSELKITKGEWKVILGNKCKIAKILAGDKTLDLRSLSFGSNDFKEENFIANAIADSINTYNKCSLLPSELLERNNEFNEKLQMCVDILNNPESYDLVWKLKVKELSEELINKSTL